MLAAPVDHTPHLLQGLVFVAVTLGGVAVAELVPRLRAAGAVSSRWVWLTAAGLAGAAAVHLSVAPEHFREAAIYGTFFLVAGLLQALSGAVLLVRASAVVVAGSLAGNLALLALWLVTRTVGIPAGPAAGALESIGTRDLVASACELVSAVAAAVVVRRALRGEAAVPVRGRLSSSRSAR